MAAPQAGPGATYVLKDLDKEVGVETERLNGQYNLIRVCLGHNSAVPPEVDLSSVKTVLDIAAGTCVWLLDFLDHPEVRDRVKDLELYASDINISKFPRADVINAYGINVFQHDVTKPFPEELLGKFDLVHASALTPVLTPHYWRLVTKYFRALLSMVFYFLLEYHTDFL